MPLIVKGLRAGLGLASEAIHANRDKKKAESNTDAPTASSASRPSNSSESDKEWCDDQGLQFEDGATTYSDATSDEAKLKERERLTRQLVAMAGPAPITPPAYPLPVPVIVPQRRARQRARGFAPAYAPVLADCGISQDVFVKFVQDLNTVNRCDGWIEGVFIAAQIAGTVPCPTAAIVSAVTSIVAGAAREAQMRHRKNTFLDLVNREVFLPRGLCAMVMTFKDDEGGPRRTGPLRQLFSQQQMRLGDGDDGMYAPDEGAAAAVDQAIAKARASGRQSSSLSSKFKSATMLSAGQTQGDAALPECAPLVFPAVDETQDKGGKMRAAKAWKDDFLDRRANVFYAAENPDSKVVVPIDNQKPLKSRFNDPDHPANSGSLISLVSGGAIATPGISGVIGRGRRTAANIAQGKGASEGGKPIKGPAASIVGKLVNQDVLYLMVVNVPTHQEMEEYVHQLDGVMHEAGYA